MEDIVFYIYNFYIIYFKSKSLKKISDIMKIYKNY